MILRKLRPDQNKETRTLWESSFTDSKCLLNYYYNYLIADTEIYVIEMDGGIRSMLHLNPNRITVGGKQTETRLLNGICTEKLYRDKGYMKELLNKVIRDMYVKGLPFIAITTKDEKMFYPFHFRQVYEKSDFGAFCNNEKVQDIDDLLGWNIGKTVTLRVATKEDIPRLVVFAEELLAMQGQIYTIQDETYYEKTMDRLKSLDGGILIAEDFAGICATILFRQGDGFAISDPLYYLKGENPFAAAGLQIRRKTKKRHLMVRILDVEGMLASMKCQEEMDYEFIVVDPVIRENNKIYCLKGDETELNVRTKPLVKGKNKDMQMISSDALTSILFGTRSLEEIEEEEQEEFSEEFKREISKLIPVKNIFLTETIW